MSYPWDDVRFARTSAGGSGGPRIRKPSWRLFFESSSRVRSVSLGSPAKVSLPSPVPREVRRHRRAPSVHGKVLEFPRRRGDPSPRAAPPRRLPRSPREVPRRPARPRPLPAPPAPPRRGHTANRVEDPRAPPGENHPPRRSGRRPRGRRSKDSARGVVESDETRRRRTLGQPPSSPTPPRRFARRRACASRRRVPSPSRFRWASRNSRARWVCVSGWWRRRGRASPSRAEGLPGPRETPTPPPRREPFRRAFRASRRRRTRGKGTSPRRRTRASRRRATRHPRWRNRGA